uniref:Tripartite motif-containing protein 2-like n=1 Tax=Saccoglossus kowalevskii TaxID=10224 RepID=A0ABM0LX80_SACKO|nr:PREDICTED: tripartite motif-containing protein 2-like [Saccoglossus kowalevskii]
MGKLQSLYGVALTKTKQVLVSDHKNKRLQLFSLEGAFHSTITFTNFPNSFCPRYSAVSDEGYIFTTDRINKQVVVCDDSGRLIRCFGNKELQNPYGIAISPTNGKVYVADRWSDCIRLYSQEGDYCMSFGRKGNQSGEINGLNGINVNSDGNVVVPEENNNRVQVFDPFGKSLFSFKGDNEGKLNCPEDVVTDREGCMYVCNYGNSRILKFDSSDRFVDRIDSDKDGVKGPQGICLTDDKPYARVIVAEYSGHCVKVFAQ